MDFTSNFAGVLTTLNNIGPGLNVTGPAGNFGDYSVLSKLVFIANMLIGRLEIFPIICLLTPSRQTVNFFKSFNRKRGKMK
jgi:trk system potassium uptake protein TrkH